MLRIRIADTACHLTAPDFMQLSFSSLESKLILEIAEKPLSVKFLHRKYVDTGECSHYGYYKTLTSLQEKGVILHDQATGILILTTKWISDGFDFFQQLKRYKRLNHPQSEAC